jgi:hypothetical protein
MKGQSTQTNVLILWPIKERSAAIAAGSQHALFVIGLSPFVRHGLVVFGVEPEGIVEPIGNHQRTTMLPSAFVTAMDEKELRLVLRWMPDSIKPD